MLLYLDSRMLSWIAPITAIRQSSYCSIVAILILEIGCFILTKTWNSSFTIVIMNSLSITITIRSRIGAFEVRKYNIENPTKLTESHWVHLEPFIEILHFGNSLEMIWYYWIADTHYFRYLSDTLIKVLFDYCFQMLLVNNRWSSITIVKSFIPTSGLPAA